ncbi:hypothetical protein L211DRAFT_879435 [Terfezia boudieri ATCC MYA-4762]|uniref:Uncharacterized protein n=1 Tax=Terfezia boudieri ATCC MYA-4762 TaxID=1051890 RepID=A0A3N4LQU4_9PEZI|nr:hypothetical protein L211DRAFT_879435 [Terfezia boudieri ATCC MYA-4762]
MSPKIFDEMWPYIDSVYTKLQQELLQNNGTMRVQKYECWLRKSKKSSQYDDSKVVKRRHTSIRDKHLCHVQIKVSCPVDSTADIIERLDEHTYTHDIEESFRIEKPSILANSIKVEAVKIILLLKYTMHSMGPGHMKVQSGYKPLVVHL